jgi:hypothetical protein
MLASLRGLWSRFCLLGPLGVLLGTPQRATIAACGCGGYLLLIDYTDGREWLDLPLRTEEYDHPDEREFTAAAEHLAARGLAWVLPWQLDGHGNLTAPVIATTGREAGR